MTRLFVAAWPPRDLAVRLGATRPADAPGIRRVPIERLHVTLRFLGDAEPSDAIGRLATCTLPTAVARIGPAIEWLGGQLVVPVAGVEPLARAVDEAIGGVGIARRHEFAGHITLARARRGASSSIENTAVTAEFRVDDVRLVESRLDPGGSVYTTLATVPVG